jgi:dipeptidyl aminopeptidase/acylaminoacyl peptidase
MLAPSILEDGMHHAFSVFRIIAALLAIPEISLRASDLHPLTFDDLMMIKRVSDPQISPNGKWLAYTVTVVDKQQNSKDSDLWVVPAAGGEARQITHSPKSDERARWSPDSKRIAYVSTRNGSSQIFVLNLEEGKSRQMTALPTEASRVLYSPDGKHLLFTSDVYPQCDNKDGQKELECNASVKKAADSSKVKAHVATRLLFRHWTDWKDAKRSHLFVIALNGPHTPKDLTPGDFDAPPFSLGGPDDYAFSPDGKEICYASNHDRNEERSTNTDLFAVDLATGETNKITANPAYDGSPQYSPDGRYIAYRAQFRPAYESDRFRLMLYDRATGQHRSLTEKFDRWVDSFAWAPNSRDLYFVAGDRARTTLFRVTINGNDITSVYSAASAGDFCVSPDGKGISAVLSSMHQPAEIFRLLTDPKPLALTHLNDALASTLDMNKAEEIWYDGAPSSVGPKTDPPTSAGFIDPAQLNAEIPAQREMDVPRIHAWILKPPRFKQDQRYPALLLVHGGPQGSWEDNWGYRWNPQIYAAAGYVVIMPDPRGSTGYGQRFIDEINGDWGGRCFQDLMLALDTVDKLAHVNKSRWGAAGASFGGFMVNWFQGHTDRFKALVAHAGDFDQLSAYYATEELWFPEWEFGGTPYEKLELYDFLSPGRYAQNFKTPELVTHGELDFRVPAVQGLAMFTALQRHGVPSKLLYFPDEGHWILKPQNSELFYKTALEWLDKFVK